MSRWKTAILLPWLKMGGTNKIALNFMRELSQYCDVTLILSENSGELLSDIPENVHLLIDEMVDFPHLVKEDFQRIRLGYLLWILIWLLLKKEVRFAICYVLKLRKKPRQPSGQDRKAKAQE